MKRTTRNNILRYAIAAIFVAAFLLIALLVCIGLEWLTDITGWPIFPAAIIVSFVYTVWRVGKGITIKNDKEEKCFMITEDFCSYEVAKLLKEKGMDKSCFNHYVQKNNNDGTSEAVTVCTLQMAMKWLREVHGIAIEPMLLSNGWFCQIERILEDFCKEYINETDSYKTYEESVESAIKYCLEDLI